MVDAVGFPTAGGYAPILEDGSFRKLSRGSVPVPVDLTGVGSLSADYDAKLVIIDGKLLDQSVRGGDRNFTLQHGALYSFWVSRDARGRSDGYVAGGGPGTATEILNLYAYRVSFNSLNLGYGAALGTLLLLITVGISMVFFRLRKAS